MSYPEDSVGALMDFDMVSVRDDVTRITQDLAAEFEKLIAAEPQQWHLLQPNWPSDLSDTRAGS